MIAKVNRRFGDDGGFSLIEAVVAALVLVLFSTGLAAMIGSSLRVTKSDKQRVAATNLAARELEITRNNFRSSDTAALAIVDEGVVTNPNPLDVAGTNLVDGTPYTVRRSAEFAPTGTAANACDGGAAVTYPNVRLAVEVTWPDMGAVKPVRVDSIITPTKRILTGSYAFVAFKVLTQAGAPNPGRTVTATGPAGVIADTTDASGCAVLGIATPGSYAVTVNEPGFVTGQAEPSKTFPLTVAAASFQTASVTYDRSASGVVTFATLPGDALPSPLPYVAVGNQALPSTSRTLTFAPTGNPMTVTGLPASTAGWTTFAGGCSDSDPTRTPTNGSLTPVFLALGTTGVLTASLAAIDVNVRQTTTTGAIAGVQVTATKTSPATCSVAGQASLALGVTDALGNLRTSLPYGAWTVRAGNGATGIAPAQSAAAQTVQVNVT